MATFVLFSGVDMVPADPATRGGGFPMCQENFQAYTILIFVDSLGLNCVLLKEESTLRDLGVTLITSIGGTPAH
jgi:hypothetical protein